MADASYDRQHLAVHAAGFINGAGTTQVVFGCSLTRISAGHFGLLLSSVAGVVDDESYTLVQTKGAESALPAVDDVSSTEKRIRIFDGITGGMVDADFEIKLFKSVAR